MERDAMGRQTGIQTDNRQKHNLRQIIPRGSSSVWWSLSAGVECPPSPHWDPPSQSQCPESWRSQMSQTYKEKTEKKNKGGVITLHSWQGKIAVQDNTIILGKECKNSDYTVEIVIVHPLKDCAESHLGGEVMSILGFCLVIGCHCSCWQYMCMRCHMATIACIWWKYVTSNNKTVR